ncbi:MAG: hypothetical protein ABI488_19515 [Polyangiaceae bacterium]
MLELKSARWAELTHADGAASDVPDLLTRLSTGDETAIEDLSEALCHQGSVFDASFAVVPHLVAIAARFAEPALKANTLVLVGLIASSSNGSSEGAFAPDIDAAYRAALPEALKLAVATLQLNFEPYDAVYLLQTAAWLHGFTTLGRVLSHFLDEEFTIQCPQCKHALYVWPDEEQGGFSTAGEDPLEFPKTLRTPIVAGPSSGTANEAHYQWLLEVGGESALSVIGSQLPYLFGAGECPVCNAPFSLLDQLSEQPS